MTYEEATKEVMKFCTERDWSQFHNPKDLAISISLEASELLENFQWSGTDLECADKLDSIKDELADVLIYCSLLAKKLNLDTGDIMHDKLRKNGQKYPVEKAKGSSKKYTEL